MTWHFQVGAPTGRTFPSRVYRDCRMVREHRWQPIAASLASDADGWLVLEEVERLAAKHGWAKAERQGVSVTIMRDYRAVEVRS